MIHHLVCFRFKPGTKPETVQRATDALLALKGKIPEIRAIRWAPNLGPSAAEYPHVLSVMLDDMPAVQRYLDHPEHVRVVGEYLTPFREARLAIDIEA